jgi:RNA polymerase sigma-70 factor, ECF subfamily
VTQLAPAPTRPPRPSHTRVPRDVAAPSSLRLEDQDSARLVAQFQAGSRDSFSVLYMRYFDRVYGYMRVALSDPHAAEDATQQVFAQALEALPRYEKRTQPFRAWLFAIARNGAINELRKRGRTEVGSPDELDRLRDHEERTDEADGARLAWLTDARLLGLIERLPSAQRQALFCLYALDLSVADTAELLDRTPESVRQLHSRALRWLRERLSALGRPLEAELAHA